MSSSHQAISHKALWERFGSLSYQDLPEDVRTLAGQCILDWFGCALAGSREPLADILRAEFADVAGPCAVVGTAMRTSPTVAALINGATSHALDFDDTSTVMGGHPTVPVFPAVLALAEERAASGTDLITALVVGAEVEGRLGSAIGGKHYARGWHVTSTMGVFGAAAGASHLLGLDAHQFGYAMGLAASQASGLKANFGTMTKPFHAGHAAERGLLSARLAARGYTSNPGAFAAPQGLVEAAGTGAIDEDRLAIVDGEWLIRHTLFKYHAACYLTHAAIESALRLRPAVAVERLAAATVTVHPSLLDVCGIPQPQTGLEAKFSLTGTTAMAILGMDTTDPATYVDALVQGEPLQRLIRRVRIETDRNLSQTQAVVELEDKTQRLFRAEHDSGVPASDLAAQGARLHDKFLGVAGTALGEGAVMFEQKLRSLPGVDDVRSVLS